HSELTAPFLAVGINVHSNNPVRADELRALDDVEADSAETEDDDIGARLDLGRLDALTDACRDPAADVTTCLKWRIFPNFRYRDLWEHREVRESRATHIVIDGLALVAEAAGAVGHHALA